MNNKTNDKPKEFVMIRNVLVAALLLTLVAVGYAQQPTRPSSDEPRSQAEAGQVSALADGPVATTGQRHGEFTLPDIETGKPVSLSDFRGKKVLLIQFASW